MTQTNAPTEYDFSGLPERSGGTGDPTTPGVRVLLLLILPVLGLLSSVLGIVLRAFADHDIASTAATASTMLAKCSGTSSCTDPETASSIIYLARDAGAAAIVTGAVLLAVGIALIVWNSLRRGESASVPASN